MDIFIWDSTESPPDFVKDHHVFLWQSYEDICENTISVPKLIEEKPNFFRNKYLNIIHDLSQVKLFNQTLVSATEIFPGISIWWLSTVFEKCNFSKSPEISDSIKLLAFTDWCEDREKPRSISICSDRKPVVDCLVDWSGKRRIPISIMGAPKMPKARRRRWIVRKLPHLIQSIAWLALYLLNSKPRLSLTKKHEIDMGSRVTFFSYLFGTPSESISEKEFQSPYWGTLPSTLRADGIRTNWIHIFIKDKSLKSLKAAKKYLRDLNRSSCGVENHQLLNDFLTYRIIFCSITQWWKVRNTSRRFLSSTLVPEFNGLNIWPLIKDDFAESLVGRVALANCISVNAFSQILLGAKKNRKGLAFYLQENMDWEYGLLQAWRVNVEGFLVGVPHSTIRFWDFRYFSSPDAYKAGCGISPPRPDAVAVNGPAARENLKASGYPVGELIEVEALRYQYLKNVPTKGLKHRAPNLNVDRLKMRLLVLGDYTLEATVAQLDLLKGIDYELRKSLQVDFRPHPACIVPPSQLQGINRVVGGESLSVQLARSDVVFCGELTSAALDAYCFGVKVIIFANPNSLNLSPLRGASEVAHASSSKDLSRILSEALSRTHSYRAGHAEEFFFFDGGLSRWKGLINYHLSTLKR